MSDRVVSPFTDLARELPRWDWRDVGPGVVFALAAGAASFVAVDLVSWLVPLGHAPRAGQLSLRLLESRRHRILDHAHQL